jgi:hypothetical protein
MNKRNKRENAKREITRQGNVEERERMREKKIKKIERMIEIMRRREEKKQK